MEETPHDEERKDLGLASAGREFEDVARPVLVEHAAGHGPGGVETEQIVFVAGAADLVQPDNGLNGFALSEVVAEGGERVIGVLDQMLGVEPVAQQRE